jgi:hypothetical protein
MLGNCGLGDPQRLCMIAQGMHVSVLSLSFLRDRSEASEIHWLVSPKTLL